MTESTPAATGAPETDPFVSHISGLDPGAKATLRRSLAFPAGSWPPAFPYVERWVSAERRWDRTVYYLVAGLQCLSRATTAEGNMGRAVSALRERTGSSSVEQRFIALLDADHEQLPQRLRQMVTLLSSHDIAPDWARLRRDLLAWNSAERFVQQRWARSYYATSSNSRSDGDEPDSAGHGEN